MDVEENAAQRPSALMAGSSLSPLASAPAVVLLTWYESHQFPPEDFADTHTSLLLGSPVRGSASRTQTMRRHAKSIAGSRASSCLEKVVTAVVEPATVSRRSMLLVGQSDPVGSS